MARRRLTATERKLLDEIAAKIATYKPSEIRPESVKEAARLTVAVLRNTGSLDDIVGATCTTTIIAQWWGVSRQAIHKAATQNRLVAVQDAKRTWHFPTWQLREDHTPVDGVIQTLEVLKNLPQIQRAAWYVQPCPQLDGLTPVEWMNENRDIKELVNQARKYSYAQQRTLRKNSSQGN